ncbi:unnamed protein product [Heterobilharzia americana]|nr:unnamed protein product [Heterobilharzia americana]
MHSPECVNVVSDVRKLTEKYHHVLLFTSNGDKSNVKLNRQYNDGNTKFFDEPFINDCDHTKCGPHAHCVKKVDEMSLVFVIFYLLLWILIQENMKCYYELLGKNFIIPSKLLGVPQNVEPIDLKKAYYKLSLQWHPDKNTKEDTTLIFQEIQEAYKVLSDPHERAWYDQHRSQILQGDGRGTQMGGTSNYQENRVDVFQYFTRSCFEKFDDGPKGFYTVYRKVFAEITKEEKDATAFSGYTTSSSESDIDDNYDGDDNSMGNCKSGSGRRSRNYPPFGSSSSSYTEIVAPFYLFWETFETKKTYTWVEKYDTRCADSRQERRAMEAENSRLRMAAIRKRNEEVHQLVAYVKKRDKRVIAEKERIQRAAEEAQARTQSLSVKAREREAAHLAEAWNDEVAFGGIASQWSEEFEAELARMEAELDGVSLQTPLEKSFKNQRTDDAEDENRIDPRYDDNANNQEEDEIDELYCVACDKFFASIKAKLNHQSSKKHRKQLELLRKVINEDDSVLQEHLSSILQVEQSRLNECEDMEDSSNISTSQPTVKLTKRAKKAERKRKKEAGMQDSSIVVVQSISTVDLDTEVINNDYAVNNINDNESGTTTTTTTNTVTNITQLISDTSTNHHSNKSSGEDSPRVNISLSLNETVKMKTNSSSNTHKIICDTCSVEFNSRNSLFNHLKESGHSRLKPKVQASVNAVQQCCNESIKQSKVKSKHKR